MIQQSLFLLPTPESATTPKQKPLSPVNMIEVAEQHWEQREGRAV